MTPRRSIEHAAAWARPLPPRVAPWHSFLRRVACASWSSSPRAGGLQSFQLSPVPDRRSNRVHPSRPLLASALSIAALMFVMPSASVAGHVDPRTIDAALIKLMEAQALVGVSALVCQNGREVYFGAFGYADRESHRPMTRSTIVHIRSMTKPVTGVALMSFYETGRFGLDDPLSKFLPEFASMKVY